MLRSLLLPLVAASMTFASSLLAAQPESIFNGKDLSGWKGEPSLWTVEDGAIVGRNPADKPIPHNTFLIWEGDQPSDFKLSLKYKLKGGNSGIQYRSKVHDEEKFIVGGYQADFEAGKTFSGILYEERGRGILAKRGEKVTIKDEGDKKNVISVTGSTGDSNEIQESIKQEDWNEYVIIAKGNHIQHFINGKLTVDVTDETEVGAKSGVIAFQIHAGPAMEVSFKEVTLEKLSAQ